MLTRQAQSREQAQAQELFVYDVQAGTISICSFGDAAVPAIPQQHFWDIEQPLLLACELARTGGTKRKRTGTTSGECELEVAMLFATPQGIVMQDRSCLVACQVRHPCSVPTYCDQ